MIGSIPLFPARKAMQRRLKSANGKTHRIENGNVAKLIAKSRLIQLKAVSDNVESSNKQKKESLEEFNKRAKEDLVDVDKGSLVYEQCVEEVIPEFTVLFQTKKNSVTQEYVINFLWLNLVL